LTLPCILAVKLGIRTRAGHHIHIAVDVQDIYMAGSTAFTNQCLLQSVKCEGKRSIIVLIATFV